MYIQGSSDLADNYNNSQPSTYDYLKPNGFRFVIKDLPNVAYTCQEVTLPTLGVLGIEIPTPSITLRYADQQPQFGDFSLTFIVSENMKNYTELYEWILGISEYSRETYNKFINKRLNRTSGSKYLESIKYSDASLFILNSSNTPKIEVKFQDLFPTNLSPLSFDTKVDNIQYLVCGATFKYKSFEINQL